jgi:hypothetical protein
MRLDLPRHEIPINLSSLSETPGRSDGLGDAKGEIHKN